MKFTTAQVTLVLALAGTTLAAPAGSSTTLSKREVEKINTAIAHLNSYTAKRNAGAAGDVIDVTAREYAIVTEILEAINDTDLAPGIIAGLVTNEDLQPIVTKTIVSLIESGTINLTTLFIALDESGLAETVITDLINDCTFYSDIYKLALSYVSDLIDKIRNGGEKREDVATLEARYDADGVVNNLLESLAESGLASSVVRELIVNKDFLSYGASLIKELFSSGALTAGDVVDALTQSDLIPDLFKQFFTVDTLKTVIVNALAAASGKCGTPTDTATTTASATATTSTSTSTGTGACKKRKRSYN